MEKIVDGLTKPITQQEISEATKSLKSDNKDIAFSGTLDEVQQYFENQGWTDGLPLHHQQKTLLMSF